MITHSIPNRRVFDANCQALNYRLESSWVRVNNKTLRIVRAWCEDDPIFPEARGAWNVEDETGMLKTPDAYVLLS